MPKANDGTMYGNQMGANQHNAGLAMKPNAMPKLKGEDEQMDDQPKSIQDDPKAMSLVDQLQQMGYTGEDVEQAMGGMEDAMQNKGVTAKGAASLDIPGIR